MKKRFHYCWLILFSCCMLQGTGFGLVNNCMGLFYRPVADSLGVSIGDISFYSSISIIASFFVMLIAPKLLARYNPNVILTLAALFTSVPTCLFSVCDSLWQWYVLGAIQGMGLAFTTNLVAPIILNNWFHEKIGFAIGLSISSSGIVGAVMSAILGNVISTSGWRVAYMISGVIGLISTVPVCIFVIAMRPEDKGMRPYGEKLSRERIVKPSVQAGRSYSQLLKDPVVWNILLVAILSRLLTGLLPHLSSIAESRNFVLGNVSLLTTVCMIGNMLSKLTFGELNDHLSARKCTHLSMVVLIICLLALLSSNGVILLFGGFLYGAISMFSHVQVPILCRTKWSGGDYANVIAMTSSIGQFAYSMSIACTGYAYDYLGSFNMIITVMIIMLIVMAILSELFLRKSTKEV